ncbi:MAG: tetratricopeptide repeat protein, partial [Planctomycetota bacterium]
CSVGTARALMLALFMLLRSAGPNPRDTELAEFKRNLDLGNGSIVFLNQHATSRFPEWLKQAERGNPIGQLFVGRCYQEGLVVEPDANVALEWLKKSANNGNSFAQVAIAFGYSDGIGGMERNVSESLRWNTLAAEQGNSTAMRNIGFLYTEGIQGKPELDKALDWFRKAAEAGNTAAMRKVADFYRSGTGVEKDEAEAEKWVARALAAGDVWLIGKKLGDEFGKQFAAYLDAKAAAARKSEAIATLQAKLPEIQKLQLNGVVAIFSASDFYVSITGLEDLPKTDPLRVVHNELVSRLITVYSAASNSEKSNNLADFTRAVDLRLASLYEDKNYVELAKIWEQCYQNIRYDQLRKNDEWNSLVRQIRFLTTALIKQGQRKEAEQLIVTITKQCQVWLKDRPWDWYLKDAYTGVCFEAADAWFETGDV